MERSEQLKELVAWWQKHIRGDEKGEAQIFLDHFLKAFGHEGALETGGIYERRVRRERDGKQHTSFADYVLNGTVLIEMKKRGEDLRLHYNQLETYWKTLEKKPPFAILCNFDELWIYQFPEQFYEPVDRVLVTQLPERQAALEFLFKGSKKTPVFQENRIDITQKAAESLAKVFRGMTHRSGESIPRDIAQRYVMQCMVALFAEDIGLMPPATFTRLIQNCLEERENSFDTIGHLFTVMNYKGKRGGRFYDVPYFNGNIFQKIEMLNLTKTELQALYDSSRENWGKINPAIFGRVFEASLDAKQRHRDGAHFTTEQDIKRIVDPLIVTPWNERIDHAETSNDLIALHTELCACRVLDPACGSGNFLFIAYREMKAIEQRLFERLRQLGIQDMPQQLVSVKQFFGFDVNSFAVELAKVTLMIAKKIVIDTYHTQETALPLDNLDDNIRVADALFTDWGTPDLIIGNPPYLGAKLMKKEHPADYINRIREAFPAISGNADYCVYWFRKAHDTLREGGRAGLVGTNTIRQNNSREGSLDYIVANNGHIYDAISSLAWSGEAKVHVSIVNWSKGKPPVQRATLRTSHDGTGETLITHTLPLISSSLSAKTDVSTAKVLACNTTPKRVFQGIVPGDKAYVLSYEEAQKLIQKDITSQQAIKPYIVGEDLLGNLESKPSRYVIDLNDYMLNEVRQFKAVYRHIETKILPMRQAKAQEEILTNEQLRAKNISERINTTCQQHLEVWWKHTSQSLEMTTFLKTLKRYIVCSRVTKRNIFDFVETTIRPSDLTQVFAFEDDYTFGILHSAYHWAWLTEKGSTLKSDYRYTPNSVFNTFPFPQAPTPLQVKAVAHAARALHEYRRALLRQSADDYRANKISTPLTLRELYRLLELPGKNPLRDLHATLDEAVCVAYGFSKSSDTLAQLLLLNTTVAERIQRGEDVTGAGIPQGYPNPDELVSASCITATPLG